MSTLREMGYVMSAWREMGYVEFEGRWWWPRFGNPPTLETPTASETRELTDDEAQKLGFKKRLLVGGSHVWVPHWSMS